MVALFDSWIHQVGLLAYVFLALAAMLEYVVPPFPGDTIVLLGGVLAVRGEKPWFWVFLAITFGSMVGAAFDYFLGKRWAARIERRTAMPSRWWGVSPEKLHDVQERMRHRGTWLLLANRFLPGIRAFIFVGAGASGLPFGRVMLWGTLSSAAWNAALMGVGIAVGGNAERLEGWVRRYYGVVYVVLGSVVVYFLAKALYKWLGEARRVRQGDRSKG
jgi:membrane protein DedA with SNARE-associated domain